MTTALGRLVDVNPSAPAFEGLESCDHVTFMPLEAVWPDGRADLSRRATKADVENGYTRFDNGDILLPKITPTFEAGRVVHAQLETIAGAATTEVHILRPKLGVDPRFVTYVCRSQPFLQDGGTRLQGVGNLRRVPTDFIRKFPVEVIEIAEQRAIADYLDEQTARIDTLIAKQNQLIDTLRERRGVVLTNILEGLSALHLRLKFLGAVTVGIVITPARWYVDSSGVPAVRGTNIRPGVIDMTDLVMLSQEGHRHHQGSELRSGDVLVVRTGQAGAAAVVPQELVGANAIDVLLVRPTSALDSSFLEMCLNSPSAVRSASELSVGALQGHLNVGTLRQFLVPDIPRNAQEAAVGEWRAQSSRLDALIAKTQEHIALAKERRAALITAAVTGQFDVRTAAQKAGA